MAYIELSGKRGKGQRTLVDDSTLKQYGHMSWFLSDTGYAVRRPSLDDGTKVTIRLHRLVTNAPEGMVVDHVKKDKLDNRLSNLRVCTQKTNTQNRKNTKVYAWDKSKAKWIVRYRSTFYGRYETEQEAKKAYQLACSGVEYKKTRRKQYMLPEHISKQFGKYVVSIQKDNKRFRKVAIPTLEEAISIRDNHLENRG